MKLLFFPPRKFHPAALYTTETVKKHRKTLKSMNISSTLILGAAKFAAMRAADYASSQSLRRHDANSATQRDVKHKLDVECEALARKLLLEAFPGSDILGEESCTVFDGPEPPAPKGLQWIIDPIDGTINFFHGYPYWCCSIAARLDGKVVAGVVYSPEMHLCYEATLDGPALCNGEPIHVSDISEPGLATVHTGEDKTLADDDYIAFFRDLCNNCQRPRVFGSAALDLCSVAHGRADGYFQTGIYIWDIAAARLICERAGGKCEKLKHRKGYMMSLLGTNGNETIAAALKACMPAAILSDNHQRS